MSQALENPARILYLEGTGWVVENECGDLIARQFNRRACQNWCRDHNCDPIPTTWPAYYAATKKKRLRGPRMTREYTKAVFERLLRRARIVRNGAETVSHVCPRAYCIAKPCAHSAIFVVAPRDREPQIKNDPYVCVQNETAAPVRLGDWCAVAYVYGRACGESVVLEHYPGG